jgi:hypothetical protein
MKTLNIILVIIIIAFSFAGCTSKNNFDFRFTVIPESNSSVITSNEMNNTAETISKRLYNSLGIPKEGLKTEVTEKQISFTISKVDTNEIAAIKKIITDNPRLEFWETWENSEIIGYLKDADSLLRGRFASQNPLFSILGPRITTTGEPLPSCMIGVSGVNDTATVNGYLKMPEVRALFPFNLKFLWSQGPYKYDHSKTLYELHAIKVTTKDGKSPLDGSAIVSARPVSEASMPTVRINLTMSAEGSDTWARITRENINRCIAIVLNGKVRSYPRVNAEITGRNTDITGDFTKEEANDLVNNLNSGNIPFTLRIINENIDVK